MVIDGLWTSTASTKTIHFKKKHFIFLRFWCWRFECMEDQHHGFWMLLMSHFHTQKSGSTFSKKRGVWHPSSPHSLGDMAVFVLTKRKKHEQSSLCLNWSVISTCFNPTQKSRNSWTHWGWPRCHQIGLWGYSNHPLGSISSSLVYDYKPLSHSVIFISDSRQIMIYIPFKMHLHLCDASGLR